MNLKILIGIAVLIVLIFGGYYFVRSPDLDEESSDLTPQPTVEPPSVQNPQPAFTTEEPRQEKVVEITSGGFLPASLTIPVGATVHFVNKDIDEHWPASDIHPTHQICLGFDSLRPLKPGESYSFTFNTAKTCPAHDHINPRMKAIIKVQ